MRSLITQGILVLLGLLVVGSMSFTGSANIANARPLLNITGTPVEPSPPTAVPATAVPGATAQPSSVPHDVPSKPEHHDGTPDLAIVKTIDQKSAAPGELIGFSLHVTNVGDKTAQNVVATDELASYLHLLDYTTTKGTVSVSGQTVTVRIDTLSPGEYVVIHIRAYVSASASGTGSNTGIVSDSNGDSNTDNNSSTVTFVITQAQPSPTVAPVLTNTPQVVPVEPTKVAVAPHVVRPAKLPVTGEDAASNGALGLMIPIMVIGLSGIVLGLYLRRRVKS